MDPGTAVLGPPGLSVRSTPNQQKTVPSGASTPFARSLDYEELPLTGDTEFRNVSADQTRRIVTVADGIGAHSEYIEKKDNAVLVLEEEESGDVQVLPYNHRWKQEYRDMVYAKLNDAERWLQSEFGEGPLPTTMITLTAKPTDSQGNPRPLGEVLADLSDGWDKFRRVIDRETEDRRTEVFRIIEPHQSGYPHIHVMVFGVANPRFQEKVSDLWVEKYGIGGEDAHRQAVEAVRGRSAQVADPAAYLMKYLSKTMARSTGEQQQVDGYQAFAALLWVTGKRQYSATEGLSAAMKSPSRDGPPPDQSWRFLGVAHGLNLGKYEGEEAAELMRHLTSARWTPPPGSAVLESPRQTNLSSQRNYEQA